jgi:hypothetical protein
MAAVQVSIVPAQFAVARFQDFAGGRQILEPIVAAREASRE